MKIIKLIMAITLATIPVTSAFMESAAAQRKTQGNTYLQMGVDQTSFQSQFNLVNTTRDGDPIIDTEGNPNLGLFQGAIQEYAEGGGQVCISLGGTPDFQPNCPRRSDSSTGRYVLDSSGYAIINPDSPFVTRSGFSPFDGDLRAEYIENDPLFASQPGGVQDTIAYSILKPGDAQPG